jgi:hypothetical protein
VIFLKLERDAGNIEGGGGGFPPAAAVTTVGFKHPGFLSEAAVALWLCHRQQQHLHLADGADAIEVGAGRLHDKVKTWQSTL